MMADFVSYKRMSENGVTAYRADGSAVFIEPGHAIWDEAVESAGPYVPPPEPTPEELLEAERKRMVCSRFQAKAALSQAGLLAQVETAVAGGDTITQIAWADATEFRRTSPTIANIAAALRMTDTQVDDLFRAAMEIEA